MPKPKSPVRPSKTTKQIKSVMPPAVHDSYDESYHENDTNTENRIENRIEKRTETHAETHTEKTKEKVYPPLIRELLNICVGEANDVKIALKHRNRQKYKNIFESYKDNLSDRDISIIKGALYYLYDFSRVVSIDKENTLWMIGIFEIPTSQIVSYTSKEILKSIAKDHGLSYSTKKASDLVDSIRNVIDPSC